MSGNEMPLNNTVQRIRKLDDTVINKIAAGEVIERPASVLKELMENSVDAGATKIEVDVQKGGTERILVQDNGTGINRDEISLALARHATSKIEDFESIESIQTLGFRGEALPSIASVSRMTLTTRTAEDRNAWKVVYEGGSATKNPEPELHPIGTSIEVRDLFFNVPARRKFLRTPGTEFTHLDKLVKQFALSCMNIEIQLAHNNRSAVKYGIASSESEKLERVALVLGDEFAGQCLSVNSILDTMKISGWIGVPDHTRSQPDQQYLFVNNRAIRDRSLMHAIRQAYLDVLYDHTRYPVCALFIDISHDLVDVNVHPAKAEVRFRKQREVYSGVKAAIQNAIAEARPGHHSSSDSTGTTSEPQRLSLGGHRHGTQRSFNLPPSRGNSGFAEFEAILKPQEPSPAQESNLDIPPLGFALAQLGGAYILSENEKGLIIVDMHASHERILYEQLKERCDNKELEMQQLLVPIAIKVTAEEADVAEENIENFTALGFDVSRTGEQIITVRATPSMLKNIDTEKLIRDVVADLIEHGKSDRVEHVRNELLASISCHSAIRANHSLSIPEMNNLLRDMETTEHSGYCSHGRPTWKQVTMEELDKMFYRGR